MGSSEKILFRRANKDRRMAQQPVDWPDRRRMHGGFVVEVQQDKYLNAVLALSARKDYIDRRDPACKYDHQK